MEVSVMAKPGPAPTPTKILNMRGAWRGKARSEDEPEAVGKLACPQWLKGDARKIWKKVSVQLTALGLVGTVDSHMLARYCALFQRWLDCEEFIRKNGMTYICNGKDADYEKEYPQVARSLSVHNELAKVERNFGMSPSARVTLVPQKTDKKDTSDNKDRYFKTG